MVQEFVPGGTDLLSASSGFTYEKQDKPLNVFHYYPIAGVDNAWTWEYVQRDRSGGLNKVNGYLTSHYQGDAGDDSHRLASSTLYTAYPGETTIPFAQSPSQRVSIVVATADGVPERHTTDFEAALRRVEPRLAIQSTPLPAVVATSLDRERLGMWLMLGFGAAALVLAAVGMFGVIAYVVSQRVGEMAIRQALGATRGQIVATVMRDGAGVAVAGVAIGAGLAWWTGRLVAGYVFDVSARDPLVLGFSAAIVALLAMFATLIPARRAASPELARSLRGE